ncbi:MAG TPA: 4-hydroxy-tetrahydrodipicolinate synthase [Bdellovibrionales bacterium]|nr:4-hydroxy-tetrahydrodipicolinate synthase [Bdellovibrionales bacterium]
MKSFDGVFTALITPFSGGEIDFDSLKRLVRFQLDNKINGFVISGTTAESPVLTDREREKIFSFVKSEVAGQVPLIVGTGTNSTQSTIEFSREAEKWGADALLTVTPYYNKPPQRGLVEHFKAVAKAVSVPVILYNVPSRTITSLSLDTIKTLSEADNIIGIKEASGDVEFGRSIYQKCGSNFLITSGDDGTWLQLCSVGGRGTISVLSHLIPGRMVEQLEQLRRREPGVMQEAEKYNDLIKLLFIEANPIPVKAALKMMGIIKSEELRLPLVPLAAEYREPLKRALERLEIQP